MQKLEHSNFAITFGTDVIYVNRPKCKIETAIDHSILHFFEEKKFNREEN